MHCQNVDIIGGQRDMSVVFAARFGPEDSRTSIWTGMMYQQTLILVDKIEPSKGAALRLRRQDAHILGS